MVATLFEDIFTVTKINPDGVLFEKVDRIVAKGNQFEKILQVDVNKDIYPIALNDTLKIVLVSTINLDGTPDSGYYVQGNRKSLADEYEYVMQGKLYRIPEGRSPDELKIIVSFGGLLMELSADSSIAAKFELDQRVFILMRKIRTGR
ncbi:unnamed protein product [Cuscuta campestris]|uniref:DNA-directed RNA polymerases I, II, and III subunit RPABC3 n=2 Tax=Cuscuta sect. Cleistogrammica TaxID=1824901 RepID=A0A484MJR5_9ASTE|nr:hypothetical protein DM860_001503 [Cuscuta australis]VFQ89211.1 unnamed protein product [Cuscuta campestris]